MALLSEVPDTIKFEVLVELKCRVHNRRGTGELSEIRVRGNYTTPKRI